MKKILLTLLTIFSIISISGCGGTKPIFPPHDPHSKPFWVDNPQKHNDVKDKTFGVGSAREHIKGVRHQRLLAISSAVNEVAQQKGVTVNSSLERMTTVSGNRANSSSQMYSKQTVDGKVVNAKIIEIWKDQVRNEIFVLMVSE